LGKSIPTNLGTDDTLGIRSGGIKLGAHPMNHCLGSGPQICRGPWCSGSEISGLLCICGGRRLPETSFFSLGQVPLPTVEYWDSKKAGEEGTSFSLFLVSPVHTTGPIQQWTTSWVQWLLPVIPATWEAEIGGLRSKASLNKNTRPCLKNH
jgi:hypothetical protein